MAENTDATLNDDIDGLLDETLLNLGDEADAETDEAVNSMDDDQLMAELDELMMKENGRDKGQGADSEQANDELDDLDAFLDEFGKGAESSDAGGPGDANGQEADIPLLDLDVEPPDDSDIDGEGMPEIVLEDVFGADLDAAIDEVSGPESANVIESEPVSEALNRSNETAKKEAAPSLSKENSPVNSADGKWLIAALASGILGVLVAAGGGWLAFDAHQQLGGMKEALRQLNASAAGNGNGKGELMELKAEVGLLGQRLSEVAVILEGPMSHVQESNKEELGAIMARLDSSEAALMAITDRFAVIEKKSQRPLVATPTPAKVQASKAVKATPSSQASQGWMLNLTSLRSEVNAQSELARLKQDGVRAELKKVTVGRDIWYRLSVQGFASKAEALAYGEQLKTQYGLEPWITKH